MLTHTIRALPLLGLIVVAHTVRPFSVANLTSFALTTTTSLIQVLPEKTLGKVERAGMLAALVTGNWNSGWAGESWLTNRLINQDVASLRQVNQGAISATYRIEQRNKQDHRQAKPSTLQGPLMARSESAARRYRNQILGAPLPNIPGLELSLLPRTKLRALPQLPLAAWALPQTRIDTPVEIPALDETNGAPTTLPKESSWTSDEIFFEPLSASILRPQTIRLHVLSPRPASGQACAQPSQAIPRPARSGKQSC